MVGIDKVRAPYSFERTRKQVLTIKFRRLLGSAISTIKIEDAIVIED